MSDWNPTDPRSPLILQELHPEPSRAAVAAEECDQCGRIGKPFDLVASGRDAMPYLMPVQRFSGPEAYVRPLAPTDLLGHMLTQARCLQEPVRADQSRPGRPGVRAGGRRPLVHRGRPAGPRAPPRHARCGGTAPRPV